MGYRVSLAACMDAMAETIRDICATEVPGVAVQVRPRMVLNPTPPTVDIYPGARDADTAAFRDVAGGYLLTVRVRVSTADSVAGQSMLIRFLDDDDPLSITVALNRNRDLGGLAADIDVQEVTGFGQYPGQNAEGYWLGSEWTVRLLPVAPPALLPYPAS